MRLCNVFCAVVQSNALLLVNAHSLSIQIYMNPKHQICGEQSQETTLV